jgi:hypothetical protein
VAVHCISWDALVRRVCIGEWKGSWDCDKCVKDTNDEVKQWTRAFVAALKASNDKELSLVKSCTIAMGLGLPPKEENALRNADIQVDCGKSVDMKSLTVAQGTVLARAIQHTYNTVHGKNPDDDSFLESVVYSAAVKAQYDDVQSPSGLTRRRYPGNLGLMHICRLCPKDDDLNYGVAVSGANLMAWQAELAAALRQSNVIAFRKIQKCTIMVLPYEAVESEEDAIMEEQSGGVRGGCAIQ